MAAVLQRTINAIPVFIVGPDGEMVNLAGLLQTNGGGGGGASASEATDTNGGVVPVWKAHSYTYDTSGNLRTDTVTDDASTWIRTYTYSGGVLTTDSGWVKQ